MQVGDALLDVIFNPDVADGQGLVIDGFPRTALQVPHQSATLIWVTWVSIVEECGGS